MKCFHTIKSILNIVSLIIKSNFLFEFPYYKVNFKPLLTKLRGSVSPLFPYYKVNFKPINEKFYIVTFKHVSIL